MKGGVIKVGALRTGRMEQPPWMESPVLAEGPAKYRNPFDPRLYLPESRSPEMQALIRRVEETLPIRIPEARTVPEIARAREETMRGFQLVKYVSRKAVVWEVPAGKEKAALRVFPRNCPRGVLLHIHGGGWWAGTADMQDELLEHYSERLDVAVASVEYRLAPEHPYPAAPDDCERAARWLVENSSSVFGSGRLLIAGESAGAHLAAVTLLRMRDRFRRTGFAGASLVFGMYDLSGLPSHTSQDHRTLVLNSRFLRWIIDLFVPDPSMRKDPDVSPLYANLAGLPRALFTVGTLDPLLDDSLFLFARWIAAGSSAELAVYPGGVHGFISMDPTPESREAHRRIEAFLARCLEEPPGEGP